MSDKAETAAIRLWRDRAHLREQERNEAQARARIAEEKVAILTAENDRLAGATSIDFAPNPARNAQADLRGVREPRNTKPALRGGSDAGRSRERSILAE